LTIASFFIIPDPNKSILKILTPGATAARKGAYLPELHKVLVLNMMLIYIDRIISEFNYLKRGQKSKKTIPIVICTSFLLSFCMQIEDFIDTKFMQCCEFQ
jgi:hypothetical protein